jgi:hypothetical protein
MLVDDTSTDVDALREDLQIELIVLHGEGMELNKTWDFSAIVNRLLADQGPVLQIIPRIKKQIEEAWDGWISKKCNVASDNHSIPAWKFYVTCTERTLCKCYLGNIGLASCPSAFLEGRFPANKEIQPRGSIGGSMNSFRYCGAEHNLEPTGVQTASNHSCKRDR